MLVAGLTTILGLSYEQTQAQEMSLNSEVTFYGNGDALTNALQKIDEKDKDLAKTGTWRVITLSPVSKHDWGNLCPECAQVNPVPVRVPIVPAPAPCERIEIFSDLKDAPLAYYFEADSAAMATFIENSKNHGFDINGDYFIQKMGIYNNNEIEKRARAIICSSCTKIPSIPNVKPIVTPTPVPKCD